MQGPLFPALNGPEAGPISGFFHRSAHDLPEMAPDLGFVNSYDVASYGLRITHGGLVILVVGLLGRYQLDQRGHRLRNVRKKLYVICSTAGSATNA